MDFTGFLAMTAAELSGCTDLPPKVAYMSCHFSPYGTGISCIPKVLPKGSALMLTDRTPVCGHDPDRIAHQLKEAADALCCSAVILDLQREENRETAAVAAAVVKALPGLVVLSEGYAVREHCAVLVSSPPLWTPLTEHLSPWEGRIIWMEAATDAALVTVTAAGSQYRSCDLPPPKEPSFDEAQHVLYSAEHLEDHAEYRLYRDQTRLLDLMDEARRLGVTEFLGLYQQLS